MIRYQYTSIRMDKNKILMAVSVAVRVQKNCNFHTLLMGMKHSTVTLENKLVVLVKLSIHLPSNPMIHS